MPCRINVPVALGDFRARFKLKPEKRAIYAASNETASFALWSGDDVMSQHG